MRMTPDQLKSKFPHASEDFLRKNAERMYRCPHCSGAGYEVIGGARENCDQCQGTGWRPRISGAEPHAADLVVGRGAYDSRAPSGGQSTAPDHVPGRCKIWHEAIHENHPPSQSPEPQRALRDEPLATNEGKETHASRVAVSIVSYRKRLLDPDNLCPKYFIDALRYEKLIPGDRPDQIELTIRQVKSKDERTEIELTQEVL